MWKDITELEKNEYNKLTTHPLQAYEWGTFRNKTGVTVVRKGFFEKNKLTQTIQLTIHKIPHVPWTIGYFPKGTMPTKEMIDELKKIGKAYNCICIQLEPNSKHDEDVSQRLSAVGLIPSAHPLFTKYTFMLDLTKSEEDLLKQMHPKTRYNVRVAQKHSVSVQEETSEDAFQAYLNLSEETTKRQGFFAHTPLYHRLMWKTLQANAEKNTLSAHLLIARYQNIPLTAWIVFVFHDSLYYPYGASSTQHRETMASNLMMWEAIRYGKKRGLKHFDMWGSLGESPNTSDPWYGFHRFKQGYGPQLVEFVGSYDLVINPLLYSCYKLADKLRWILLRLKK
ncbi:MAG: peptidoglycan bridge formation glycyltransferase FemA/FemB family protein [Patescibacteria group bacterium]|nr:peptidoglycan bridge formation glycyltransferase FemA/FemB family protein [Patescibacteria group bacterium]